MQVTALRLHLTIDLKIPSLIGSLTRIALISSNLQGTTRQKLIKQAAFDERAT
jgi:hypothetical protein